MSRGFFKCLQQSVEGSICNLVSFIKDVNLETVACWSITRRLAQLSDFVNSAVGGSIDFNYID
jgi:hypothetical protein